LQAIRFSNLQEEKSMLWSKFARCAAAVAFAVAFMLSGITAAFAQEWPAKRVTVIVPFGPGGPGDVLLRAVTDRLEQKWKQPVIVEYKPGAAGLLAHEYVAKSPADGYTLLQASSAYTVYNILNKDLRFDPIKDLTIAAMTGLTAISYVTSANAPVKNVQEFVAWVKANPGKINYASLGKGVVMLSMELMAQQTGIHMTEVPYKTQPDMVQGVMRDDVQLALLPAAQTKQLAEQGRIKPLFVVSSTRFRDLPNVPTAAEAGLPNFRPLIWQSIMAPSATPRAVLNKINADVGAIVALPEYPGIAEKIGMLPFTQSPDEIKKLTDEQVANWTAVARALNIKPE
jgi:tripartite-type tricarboxylate transporter receptor subunit TctC